MTYLLIDSQNMFYRATHVTRGDIHMRASMAIHITLTAIAQAWRMFNAEHVVLALESRSKDNWRKAYDKKYKDNRAEHRKKMTPKELEEQEVLFEYLNGYLAFMSEKTNVSVLRCPIAEADDMISRWIHLHPNDKHVIVSSDKDFQQLLSENVIQYNGISKKIFLTNSNKMTENLKLPKEWKFEFIEDPEYVLFEKIVRGDLGDNVFSAYPGVRKKAGKDKPSINNAFADRYNKGFDWNNFMNQKWTDHNDEDHLVRECFDRNRMLVDLSAHPDEISKEIDNSILETVQKDAKTKIGWNFGRFCNEYELNQLSEKLEIFTRILSAGYENE